MGVVEGLESRKVLLEVTILDEDDLTDEEVRQACSTALRKAARTMYSAVRVKVLNEEVEDDQARSNKEIA